MFALLESETPAGITAGMPAAEPSIYHTPWPDESKAKTDPVTRLALQAC